MHTNSAKVQDVAEVDHYPMLNRRTSKAFSKPITSPEKNFIHGSLGQAQERASLRMFVEAVCLRTSALLCTDMQAHLYSLVSEAMENFEPFQKSQYPLVRELTLNGTKIPKMIEGIPPN